MKNVEFYANELADLAVKGKDIAIRKNDGIPCVCNDLNCDNCLLNYDIDVCRDSLLNWAESEHVEYEVDWMKVPIDTPVYYQVDILQNADKGYFAKFKNGVVYIWKDGKTSFTSRYRDDICSCQFVRLAEPHPEWMKRKERENK